MEDNLIRPKFKFVMTVTDGRREETVVVDEDKRKGGLARMSHQALIKAASRGTFPRGVTIWIKNNWSR